MDHEQDYWTRNPLYTRHENWSNQRKKNKKRKKKRKKRKKKQREKKSIKILSSNLHTIGNVSLMNDSIFFGLYEMNL